MNPLILIMLPFLLQAQPTVKGLSLPEHPRLLWLAGEEAKIKQQIGRSEEWSRLHQGILAESDSMMALPALERIQTGRRLLSVSRECLRRVLFWSYSWRMTQEPRYLQRALRELLAVCAFSDWNPSHFLDVAEMTTAVAIGYDWLYHGLSEPDRVTIRQALWEKGIAPSLLPKHNDWLRYNNNWNQVCNAGMTLGAMAIFEHHPEQATALVDRAMAYNRNDWCSRKYQRYDYIPASMEDGDSPINFRVLRYADVLLMYAEVLNELGRTSEAIALVNRVRARPTVNMPAIPTILSQAQARQAIRDERLWELGLEQVRRKDVLRWGAAVAEAEFRLSGISAFRYNIHRYLPIPQEEIDFNQALTEADQNPGY